MTALSLRPALELSPRPRLLDLVDFSPDVKEGAGVLPEPRPQAVPVPGVPREIAIKVASERAEWEQAFRLVASNYRRRGYEAADSAPFRFMPYHALPDTSVFVARHREQVVATLSVVLDNTLLGLPLEAVYPAEVAGLRDAGRRLMEVTSLADQGLGVREFAPVFVVLMRFVGQYLLHSRADTVVITINPRHRLFYSRVLGFVPLGPCRQYAAVCNHPAEAYLLDVPRLRANSPAMYRCIFGEELSADTLRCRPLPRELVHFFSAASSHADRRQVEAVLEFVQRYGSPRRW
jgi:hypothetical protein